MNIYSIPFDDKFIIYAPLKPLAFVGNSAMLNYIVDVLNGAKNIKSAYDDVSLFLRNIGLFLPNSLLPAVRPEQEEYKPTICILMPTTACNLRCTYCYASNPIDKNNILPWPTAKIAIDTVDKNAEESGKGPFTLGFHGGGEPTCAFEFFKTASLYAKSLEPNCTISLTTNGYWSNDQRQEILDLVDEVSLSFDGNEKTQNSQRPDSRGNGTFATVMKTIDNLEKKGIRYGIRLTVTQESMPVLIQNMDFLCKQTACQTFQIEPVYNQGRAVESAASIENTDLFVMAFMESRQRGKEAGRTVYYSAARPWAITSEFCQAFSSAMIVTAQGELTSCYEVFDRSHIFANDFIFGRLDENKGIILYPEKREELAKKISINRKACEGCFCYYHCAGDCPSKNLLARANNDTRRCDITRMITRELILERIAESNGLWRGDVSLFKTCGNSDHSKNCTRSLP